MSMTKFSVSLDTIRTANQARIEGRSVRDFQIPEKVKQELQQTRYSEEQINEAFSVVARRHALFA